MADKRISEFVAATAAAAADLLVLVQGGANKKLTIANLFANINTPVSINPLLGDVDTTIAGDTDANLVKVDASADAVGIGTATPAQKLDVNGSLGTNGLVAHKSVETISAAGACSLTKYTTIFDTSSSFSATLANGTAVGHVKKLISKNSGTITLTATTPAGWTQIVFNAAYQSATLEWQDSKWVITASRGVTIS
jgi:uncharacterized protein YfiM (DUF2279 family)